MLVKHFYRNFVHEPRAEILRGYAESRQVFLWDIDAPTLRVFPNVPQDVG